MILLFELADPIMHYVQACAKQVLGLEPVAFDLEAVAYDTVGLYTRLRVDPPFQHIYDLNKYKLVWNPAWGGEQWWFDGMTIDPSMLLTDLRGIWEHGVEQPVTVTKLENASVGTLPKVMVYIAVHAKFGTHIWFPFHGAKHGGPNKAGDNKMYADFEFWFTQLPELEKAKIVHKMYYNPEKSVEKFQATATQEEKEAFGAEGEFDAVNFLVCSALSMLLCRCCSVDAMPNMLVKHTETCNQVIQFKSETGRWPSGLQSDCDERRLGRWLSGAKRKRTLPESVINALDNAGVDVDGNLWREFSHFSGAPYVAYVERAAASAALAAADAEDETASK